MGANGSGKTYLIRRWMEALDPSPFPRRHNLLGGTSQFKAPEYYRLSDGGCVIGDYTTACGGCDAIDTQEEVRKRILQNLDARYVLFEGVIVSTIFDSWLQFSRAIGGMLWVYMDTPLNVCLERVYGRNKNQRIKEQLIADKIRSIDSTRRKALACEEETCLIDHLHAEQQFATMMRNRFPV